MKPWKTEWRFHVRRLSQGPLLLLLDFDGTLAPIVKEHWRAQMSGEIRKILVELLRLHVQIAIISGRGLADVKRHVLGRSFFYAGDHGMDIQGPRIRYKNPGAVRLKPLMRVIARQARSELSCIPGACVEEKKYSLSLHERRIDPSDRHRFHQAVANLQIFTRRSPVLWRYGKRVWEVLPKVNWNKGKAAKRLIRHLKYPTVVAVGDDQTDEDLFQAVGAQGFSIRVTHNPASCARYFMSRQRDVIGFLQLIRRIRSSAHD